MVRCMHAHTHTHTHTHFLIYLPLSLTLSLSQVESHGGVFSAPLKERRRKKKKTQPLIKSKTHTDHMVETSCKGGQLKEKESLVSSGLLVFDGQVW